MQSVFRSQLMSHLQRLLEDARATTGPKTHPSHGDGATVGLSPQDMSITFDLLLSVQATKARESGGGGSSELRVYHRRTGWRNISVALSVC